MTFLTGCAYVLSQRGAWQEYSASLYGMQTVTMNFGFGNRGSPYYSKAYFDHFQILGDGDDVSTLLCAGGCQPGSYRIAGMSDCTRCAAGTADLDASSATACETCSAGSYSGAGDSVCTACAAGTYAPPGSAAPAGAACVQCASGTYDSDSSASTMCEDCPAGSFGTQGACDGECPTGSYSPPGSSDAQQCVTCAAGTYDDDLAPGTVCVDCAAGRYTVGTQGTECTGACDAGTFAPPGSATASDCVACVAGESDHDADPATACERCAVGTYSAAGQTTCTACPAGQSTVSVRYMFSSDLPYAFPYTPSASLAACVPVGCTDPKASDYDPRAVVPTGCSYTCSGIAAAVHDTATVATADCILYDAAAGEWPDTLSVR